MPWVRFTQSFDYKPKPAVTIAYRAGSEYLVKRDCAAQALAAGKAVAVVRTRKAKADASR